MQSIDQGEFLIAGDVTNTLKQFCDGLGFNQVWQLLSKKALNTVFKRYYVSKLLM
jgi:hypothetical protein